MKLWLQFHLKILIKNPITLYFYFLVTFVINKIRFNNFFQEYMAKIKGSEIGRNVRVYEYASVNSSKIGSYSYIGRNSRIRRATIGKFCCIGPNCIIGVGMHPSHTFVSTHPIFYSTWGQVGTSFANKNFYQELDAVEIGNDVWIGANVIIMDSVKIGNGAIIAAGAVLTKDVPDYAIYGGVPAKLIRFRFSENVIEELLRIRWWDKDEAWLRDNYERLHDVDSFIKNYKGQ